MKIEYVSPNVTPCAYCNEYLHLQKSLYVKDGKRYYHNDKVRPCWKKHQQELELHLD